MKKLLFVLGSLLMIQSGWAQTLDETKLETVLPEKTTIAFSHSDVFWTGAIPYFSTYLGVSTRAIFPEEYADHIFSTIILLGNIPHCLIDPAKGIQETTISAGAYTAGFILDDYPQFYGNQSFANTFKTIGLNTSFWSYYQGYAKARSMAAPGIYSTNYKNYTFNDLLFAPYNMTTLTKPSVWLPASVYSAGLAGMYYLDSGFDDSVWATGKAYIGNKEIPIMLGLVSTVALSCISYSFTGVGEESLFRGVGYEEMKVSFGVLPAKLVDSLGFPACHIPQEIQKGLSPSTIAFDYGIRSLMTLGLEWAYDEGGLEYSVAQHMWIDVLSSTLLYLFYAGNGDNDVTLSLNFTVPL